MRCIERLPEDIHNSVRSGVVICDFSRLVEELVFNSLDAAATKVYVAVDVGSCCVKVMDNGSGIIRDDLVLLGERYATSKVDHMSDMDEGTESFHSHGEALCSISCISLLEVVTKARGKPYGYKKIIKNCKCLFLGINDDIEDMGTTVTVRDIFYNQPVRRKHMKFSPQKVLDLIKMSVLRIALVHVNVCFKVVDMECNHELLRTGPSSSPLSILFSNFGIESSLDFYHLNISDGSVKLSGYISGPCETLSPKAIQYFYVNSRFICKGPIHKLLNQLAAKFDLSNSWKPTTDSVFEKQNRCHLIPTFILNLNCPRSYYDIVTSDRSRTTVEFKDWIAVLNFVETGVKSLWMKNIIHDVPIAFDTRINQPRKQNCQTSPGLNTPLLNKTCNGYIPEREGWNSPSGLPSNSDLKKQRGEITFLCDTDYTSRSCNGSLASQTSPGLNTPLLNKTSNEHIPKWEGWISPSGLLSNSDLKKHRGEISFLCDTDYTSRSCNGSLANDRVMGGAQSSTQLSPSSVFSPGDHHVVAFSSGKQQSGRSYAALPGILPKIEDNTSMWSGVSAGGLDFGIDLDLDLDIEHGLNSMHSSPSSVFSPGDHHFVPYTSGKQQSSTSYALPDILPKFENDTSMPGGITAHGRHFGNDIGIRHDPNKSVIRSCSVRRSLPDRTPATCDERFEFKNDDVGIRHCPQKSILRNCSALKCLSEKTPAPGDERFELKTGDFRVKKKSVSFEKSVDDIEGSSCRRELQINRLPPSQVSRRDQFNVHERSKVPMEDKVGPYLDVVFDSPIQVQKCHSGQQYLNQGWSPITEKPNTMIRFEEDDVDDANLFQNYSEFGEDASDGYANWGGDGIMDNNFDPTESWWQQDGSSPDLFLYPKRCSYRKRKTDVSCCGNFGDSFSPYPSKRPREIDRSPSRGEECSKDYLIPTLHESASMEYGCEKRNGRDIMPNKKNGPVRSHSAPPLYRGKKKFSCSSDSSSFFSAKANMQTMSETSPCTEGVKHTQILAETRSLKSQKSIDQDQPSPVERSVAASIFAERPSAGWTPEVIKIQNNASQKRQLIDESAECLDLKEIQDPFDPGVKWQNDCSPTAGPDRNTSFNNKVQDDILDISSNLLCVSGDTLVPKSIEKTSLDHAKVLSQVDKKFIAVVAGTTLAVIDQHAADERIRLEELRHKVLSGEMKTITYLDDERELVLPEVGYQLLQNYADQIRAWGWICNIHSHHTTSFAKNIDFLHRHPSVVKLLAVPCILGVNLTDNDLLEFLQQLADTDGSSTVPPSVYYILNSKACRGAIMFGDTLLPSECSLIVDELKRTSLCFQCAHGRPTMVPLVNLDVLQNKVAKLAPSKSWHGLRKHKLTLERSTSRLNSARC